MDKNNLFSFLFFSKLKLCEVGGYAIKLNTFRTISFVGEARCSCVCNPMYQKKRREQKVLFVISIYGIVLLHNYLETYE